MAKGDMVKMVIVKLKPLGSMGRKAFNGTSIVWKTKGRRK